MLEKTFKDHDLYFDDPRLSMTIAGRIFVRVFSYIGYLLFAAAAATFVISDLLWLSFSGGFLFLFFVDALVHWGEADKPISEFPKPGSRINLASHIKPRAFSVIEKAFDRGLLTKRNFFLETIRQCLNFSEIEKGLRRLDVSPEEFKQKTEDFLANNAGGAKEVSTKKIFRDNAEALVIGAFHQAIETGHKFIELSDLFSAMPLIEDEEVARLFSVFEIEAGDLGRALIFSSASRVGILRRLPSTLGGFTLGSHMHIRHRVMNRAWTSRPTPTLDKYATDFTDLARHSKVGFLIGHEEEFNRLVDTLARPINPNALLIGEAGIGKDVLVTHLAFRLVKDKVPEVLFDKRLVALELSNLVAGAPPEELNARLRKIVEEIIIAGNVILYIPDIHNLVKTSGTAYISAADALMPVIMHNTFPVVGATYPREHKELIEPRSDFSGVFEAIRVQEVSEKDAEKILSYESLILERRYGVTISFGAVKKAVSLAKKYFHNKFLPSSAEELLKSALVETKRKREKFLGPDQVISATEAKIHIPIKEAAETEAKKLLNLENIIHESLIDQNEAVKAVSDALREYRSGLTRQGGPIASFLFVGPTGVGKTELAKTLAKVQFGSNDMMVRFDMTEYQDKQSFYRFIGSPDGKIRGALTDAILQKPYSLVLLDEFEKAYPDILNLFLQVLDDGRLTDNLGRVVDFQNTIVIATSNAHSDIINTALNQGQSMSEIAGYLKRKLVDVFRPELINRFSKIVIFKSLEPADLEKIVVLNLRGLAKLVSDKGIVMDFEPAAVKKISKLGYDPAFGARPLRRVIDEKLRAPLASAMLEGKITRGNRIRLTLRGEEEFEFVVSDK